MNQKPRIHTINAVILWMLLFGVTVPAVAQQQTNFARIGYLLSGFKPPKEFFEAMSGLGYIDGYNVAYQYRSSEGGEERLFEEALDFSRHKLAVIVVAGADAALAAKKATQTIPIVYLGGGDPVRLGLVSSLARPGGNLTGITELSPELTAKRLQLIKEILPKISAISVLARAGAPGLGGQVQELQHQAKALRLKLQILELDGDKDIESSLAKAVEGHTGALIEVPNPFFHANISRIVKFASNAKLPAIFHSKDFVEAGGLMAYGAEFTELYRRAAVLVDKVLKGAKPADLPVEQPKKFELVINLKTAKQVGLTIPPNVLARADRVIK